MEFVFRPMDRSSAKAIAEWHYMGSLAFYDMEQDQEDLGELLDSSNWCDRYYSVLDYNDELVGFFCFEEQGASLVVGLGLKPEHTGRGLGQAFVEAGLEFARKKFNATEFRLSVATFNTRAIKVYERAGFEADGVFTGETNGGTQEFLRMVKRF